MAQCCRIWVGTIWGTIFPTTDEPLPRRRFNFSSNFKVYKWYIRWCLFTLYTKTLHWRHFMKGAFTKYMYYSCVRTYKINAQKTKTTKTLLNDYYYCMWGVLLAMLFFMNVFVMGTVRIEILVYYVILMKKRALYCLHIQFDLPAQSFDTNNDTLKI